MAIEGLEIIFSDKIPALDRRKAILKILGINGIGIELVDSPIIQKGGETSKKIAFSIKDLSIIIQVEMALKSCQGVVIKEYTPKSFPLKEILIF